MACSVVMVSTIFSFLFVLYHGAEAAIANQVMNIGEIIDVNSRTGKEEKIGMEVAVQYFNKNSKTYNVSLYIRQLQRVTSVAEEMIKEKKVWHAHGAGSSSGSRRGKRSSSSCYFICGTRHYLKN